MALPTLSPVSNSSVSKLPVTGTAADVAAALPYGVYSSSTDFLSGAAQQVAYVYKKLGGDVLDLEITEYQVYAAYEEAVLEYSYLVNIHQAKNAIGSALGTTTGSFDQFGNVSGSTTASEDDPHHFVEKNLALRFPKFDIANNLSSSLTSCSRPMRLERLKPMLED